MSLIARSNPFANKPTALKAAADILSRSTFYNLNEEQFIERVHFDISTFICQKSSDSRAVLIFPAVSPR